MGNFVEFCRDAQMYEHISLLSGKMTVLQAVTKFEMQLACHKILHQKIQFQLDLLAVQLTV